MIKNRIIKSDKDWVLLDASTPANPNSAVLMDKHHFDTLPDRTIYVTKRGYPRLKHNYKGISLHKLVVDFPMVDHVNQVKTDCREENLRSCTNQQNQMNTKAKGVRFRPNKNDWTAQITVNKKQIHLGRFKTESEAREARRAGEVKHFGEFA